MGIRILAVGKKHERWVSEGIARYEERLRKPFDVTWQLLPHSQRDGEPARAEESERILAKLSPHETVVLLDERGEMWNSEQLSRTLAAQFDAGSKVTCIIGGAYGVSDEVRRAARFVWSLSPLVFPHQLVRLVLAEQLYRAQEIVAGSRYHHV